MTGKWGFKMTEKDIEIKRKEVISRLNEVLDNYKNSNERMGYIMQIGNLERLVEHMEKCYDFDIEFPSESD